MSGDLKRTEETIAAQAVADCLGATTWVSRNEGHDFEVHLPDGRRIALEVTQAMVAAEVEAWKALSGGWEPRLVTMHWHLSLIKVPKVKKMFATVEQHLRVLEQHAVYAVDPTGRSLQQQPAGVVADAIGGLRAFGIRRARGFPGTGPLLTV